MYNYAVGGLTLDPQQRNQGLQDYLNSGKQFLSGFGNSVSGLVNVPVLNQGLQTFDQFQNETVRRPVGTASLVFGDTIRGDANPFDAGVWRQAYNDTRRVSAGQAIMYGGAGGGGMGVSRGLEPGPRPPFGRPLFPAR